MTTLDQNNRQLASDYIAQGWQLCVIPKGTKGPTTVGWNDPSSAVRTVEQLPDGFDGNIGLLHAWSGTCAIDIDNEPMAREWLTGKGIDLPGLMDADDAVQIHSGNPHHGKLIYKLPKWLRLPSKRVVIGGKTILEFRHGTAEGLTNQDVLPPSIHPKGAAYQWAGKGSFTALPDLPASLMGVWQELIDEDAAKPTTTVEHDTTPFALVESAVLAIPADCDRKTHTEVGMALHLYGQQSDQSEQAKELFLRWSRTGGEKYISDADVLSQWNSYRNDKATVVTLGTVLRHAQSAGWQRPPPDVSGMFSAVPTVPAKGKEDQWGDPVIDESLFTTGVPHPTLDMSILPPQLLAAAMTVSEDVGCDPMVPIAAGLVALCAVADARSTLRVKEGMTVRPILRAMAVGNASDSKTPGSRPMMATVEALQVEDRARYAAAMLAWGGSEAAHAADTKAYNAWAASPESGFPGAIPPTVRILPDKPVELRLKTNGSTTAKVLGMLANRPYGMTYILDDGSEWLESLVNPNRYDSKTVYLRTYDGGPDNVDRVGNGELYLPNCALSMYINAHPDVLYKHREKLSTDGALQRMIPIPLDLSKTTAGGSPPDYTTKMKAWDEVLRRTYANGEMSYALTPEASARWQEFKDETTTMKKELYAARYSNYMVGYAGKLDGLAARVALVFHMMTDPYIPEVGVDTLNRAIVFARYALRCAAFIDSAHMDAESIEVWIIRHIIVESGSKTTITPSEIIRSGRRQFDGMTKWAADDAVFTTLKFLASRGWVAVHTDHPRFPVWGINPALKTMLAGRRDEIVKARAAIVAKIRGDKTEGKP